MHMNSKNVLLKTTRKEKGSKILQSKFKKFSYFLHFQFQNEKQYKYASVPFMDFAKRETKFNQNIPRIERPGKLKILFFTT